MSDSKSTEELREKVHELLKYGLTPTPGGADLKGGYLDDLMQLFDQELAKRVEEMLDKVEAQCEYCSGTGFMDTYTSGGKYELPEREPCDGEIHEAVASLNKHSKEEV